MKLVTFQVKTVLGQFNRIGALVNNRIIDLNSGYAAYLREKENSGKPYEIAAAIVPPDMVDFFKGGDTALEAARKVTDFVTGNTAIAGPKGEQIVYAPGEVKILAPVPRPNSIRDTLSFEGHIKHFIKAGRDLPPAWYEIPVYYKGNPCSVIGPDEPVLWPPYTEKLDYELEFGCYICKQGKNIKAEEADKYIAGYTIFNDISARDIQAKESSLWLGPAKGKDFDNGNIMGPCLVTPDELDVTNMKMVARVNGETWSEGNSKDMYYSFPQLIEYISTAETLYPGDFIGSGTVSYGSGAELDRWLQPGDVIEFEIEGIGILRNNIIRE